MHRFGFDFGNDGSLLSNLLDSLLLHAPNMERILLFDINTEDDSYLSQNGTISPESLLKYVPGFKKLAALFIISPLMKFMPRRKITSFLEEIYPPPSDVLRVYFGCQGPDKSDVYVPAILLKELLYPTLEFSLPF